MRYVLYSVLRSDSLRRKPMLFKRLSVSTNHEGKRTIGLIGVNRGVGVTYTGMLLAYYFGTEKRIKTAYLECNKHQDFERLQEAYEWSKEDESSFSLDGITYYKQVSKNQIPELLNEEYNCYILDFGMNYLEYFEEFIRCDIKIVIGDRAIWNQKRMVTFTKSIDIVKGSKHWIHMIPCAGKMSSMGIAKKTGRCIYGIPNEPDPTSLSKETHKLFYNLFG